MADSQKLGFVIDTAGSATIDPPKYLKDERSSLKRDKDEVESKLEEILFGKQPFQAIGKTSTGLLDSDTEIEEVNSVKS